MQRYVFYAEAKCRAGIKNVKRETKDVVSVTKSGSSPRFGLIIIVEIIKQKEAFTFVNTS